VPRIALKDCGWERVDDRLIVVSQGSKLVELHDPDGSTEAFLTALAAGPQTADELRARLAAAGSPVSAEELADALAALDSIPLLEDPDGASFADAELDLRHFSNLAFFQEYSGLQRTPTDLQCRLVDAHVLQLGTGGLGSNVLQCLAGLGVGRLTLWTPMWSNRATLPASSSTAEATWASRRWRRPRRGCGSSTTGSRSGPWSGG